MPDASTDLVQALTLDALHAALNDAGYIYVRDRVRCVRAALMTDPLGGFFAFRPSGTGRTWLLEVLGDIFDMNTFSKQVSPGSREEDLILDLLPDEDAQSGIKKQWGGLAKAYAPAMRATCLSFSKRGTRHASPPTRSCSISCRTGASTTTTIVAEVYRQQRCKLCWVRNEDSGVGIWGELGGNTPLNWGDRVLYSMR